MLWSRTCSSFFGATMSSLPQSKRKLPFLPLLRMLSFPLCYRELQYWQKREHTHDLQRTITEIPWSCNVASNPCQWSRKWIQISCDLYTITNSYCFSSPDFVNLSPITFYFVGTTQQILPGFINKYRCQSYITGTCTVFIFPALIRRHQSFIFPLGRLDSSSNLQLNFPKCYDYNII